MANWCLMRGNCVICYSDEKKLHTKWLQLRFWEHLPWAGSCARPLTRIATSSKTRRVPTRGKLLGCRHQHLNTVLLSQIHALNLLSGFLALRNINNNQTKQKQETNSVMRPYQNNTNYDVSMFRISVKYKHWRIINWI